MNTPEPLKLSDAALETAKAEVDHVYWWEKKTFYTAISGGVYRGGAQLPRHGIRQRGRRGSCRAG
jgi:hypothetical protein